MIKNNDNNSLVLSVMKWKNALKQHKNDIFTWKIFKMKSKMIKDNLECKD
mgnify:FL=1